VGVTARHLAKLIRVPLADEAFLAGMIHDVGLLVSLQATPEALSIVCEKAKQSTALFCDLEREVSAIDHQVLGQALCERWKFPRSCQLVAGFHHRPQSLDQNHRLLVSLVYIADTLCCKEAQGFNLTALNQTLEQGGVLDVGIDPLAIEQARQQIPSLLANSASMFGADSAPRANAA
jgi:HD-like signal output (HDOD) protein